MRVAIFVTFVACLATAAFAVRVRNRMPDFEVYWTAGERAAAGQPLYRASDLHYQFKYFPASAFVFTPFAVLPVGTAKALWFALSVGLLAALLALSVQQLPLRTLPASLIAVGTIVTLGKFYAHELELGQANLLFGVVAIAAVAQLQKGRGAGAGVTFGSAAIVKPYGLVFLPYLLATKQFRAAAACSAVLAVALAAPAIVYGLDGNRDLLVAWWRTVTGSTLPNLTNPDNVSIAAMYAKWLGAGSIAEWLTIITSTVLLGTCAAVVGMRRRAAAPEYLEVALLLTVITLLSPQGWDYVLLLSTPAVILIINVLPRLSPSLRSGTIACLALIGLTIYDVIGRAAYGRFMALSVITVVYGLLIGLLVYMRAKQMQ